MKRVLTIVLVTLGAVAAMVAQGEAPTPRARCVRRAISPTKRSRHTWRRRLPRSARTSRSGTSRSARPTSASAWSIAASSTSPAPESVAEHDLVSEVYHIIDGSATLVTGPDLVGKKRRPADLETVRLFNGPGNNSASIRNGVTHQLKAGDVIVIPAGTGHWFTKIDDHITYLMVRIDPDKVTPIKTEADSKAYLPSRDSEPSEIRGSRFAVRPSTSLGTTLSGVEGSPSARR